MLWDPCPLRSQAWSGRWLFRKTVMSSLSLDSPAVANAWGPEASQRRRQMRLRKSAQDLVYDVGVNILSDLIAAGLIALLLQLLGVIHLRPYQVLAIGGLLLLNVPLCGLVFSAYRFKRDRRFWFPTWLFLVLLACLVGGVLLLAIAATWA